MNAESLGRGARRVVDGTRWVLGKARRGLAAATRSVWTFTKTPSVWIAGALFFAAGWAGATVIVGDAYRVKLETEQARLAQSVASAGSLTTERDALALRVKSLAASLDELSRAKEAAAPPVETKSVDRPARKWRKKSAPKSVSSGWGLF